jgi:succinoglycan biosynthesis protein ExoA
VVADGGSTDGTQHLVRLAARRFPNLRLLDNPERTQSTGINRAVRSYGRDARVLIRCDAHAEYPRDFCRRLIATLERTGADAVVVPLDSVGEHPLQRAIAWTCNSPLGTGGAAHRAGQRSGFVDHGHHAAFRMDTFRKCGGYDPSFTCNEDAEFDCRQRALGARVYLDAEVRVRYYPRRTFGELWGQYFRYGAGRSRTVQRHPSSLRARQLAVPAHLIACSAALGLSLRWPLLLAWPALYCALLALHSVVLSLRHRSIAGLLGGPAALVLHTAWAVGFLWGSFRRRESRWAPHEVPPLSVPRTIAGNR